MVAMGFWDMLLGIEGTRMRCVFGKADGDKNRCTDETDGEKHAAGELVLCAFRYGSIDAQHNLSER